MSQSVEVEIRCPDDIAEMDNATVRVCVDDVTMADAAARTVAEQTLRNVRLGAVSVLRVSVPVPDQALDPRADYNVRVCVNDRGDRGLRSGDLISMEAHPVLTYGRPTRVAVPLRRIP